MLLHKTRDRKLAFEKVERCIKTSTTLKQLNTTQRLLDNYVKLFDPLPQLVKMLQGNLYSRRLAIRKEVYDGK